MRRTAGCPGPHGCGRTAWRDVRRDLRPLPQADCGHNELIACWRGCQRGRWLAGWPDGLAGVSRGAARWFRRTADILLWDFTGSHVTTYAGNHGTILGPWVTAEFTDTASGTAAGAVVMSPSGLSGNGQDFGAWLRHR